MSGPSFQHHPGEVPAALPHGLDPMSVGQSIFGHRPVPERPTVDGYSELTFLAQGGLGHVWQARRNSDGTAVALKIPHQTDPESAERLVLEAEALQSLDHPHIVRLLGLTEDAGGAPVIVMEFVDGPSLTERLPKEGFEFDHALQILLPVLDAVAHAHSRGIVHRDLKPSNILLTADGTPKVSDFGLAQSLKAQRVAFSLTRSGILAGTVEYLAPERYEPGNEASTAADIYGLGVILYEILTGRPPRGAWQPLSQAKHLDVRLDELMAEAIHPDPAKRLPSAAIFRKRLEEIRDSRPRYAGTPLMTRPVRYADAVWTVAGLYFLAAGFCSLLRINNTEIPGAFDLTFNHTRLLGGFWALWVLTIGMGVLWMWQAIRLWLFRRVPLREALPSPFGLRLGSGHGAVVVVGVAQILCVCAPIAYIVWIYSQVWIWASADTPVWGKVLAVTQWGSVEPISPWTWDPANFFNGGSYWIREMQPGLSPGTWRLHDRQSFFIVTQPLAMVLGAAGVLLGMFTTCVAVISEWSRKHKCWLSIFLLTVCSAVWLLSESVRHERANLAGDQKHEEQHYTRLYSDLALESGHFLETIFDAVARDGTDLPVGAAAAFAPTVQVGNDTAMDRASLLRELEAQRRETLVERPSLENVGSWFNSLTGSDFHWVFAWEKYTDAAGVAACGEFFTINCRGLHGRREEFITVWNRQSTPLYSADSRVLTSNEANAWLSAFLQCLTSKDCPELEQFFLPVLLSIEPSDSKRFSPAKREPTVEVLRTSRASWLTLGLVAVAPPNRRPLPGARWELTCDVKQVGTRLDGHRGSAPQLLHWQLELVYTEGRWQALRFRL